jgi:protein-disulfide isomerase-like protein with CxxC motif
VSADPSASLRDDASSWALDYVQRSEDLFEPVDGDEVRIDLVTDPWSVWCWGLEPVRRAIEQRFPAITFGTVVGGMFERLPHHEHPQFDLSRFLSRVQRITGMPVATDGFEDGGPESTYPACVHAHAMRLLDPDKAELGLRKLREAAWLDGRDISDVDVATDVAVEAGYEREAFRSAMASGEPEREFKQRLSALERRELSAYPTLLVRTADQTRRLEGFVPLPGLIETVERLSGRTHVPSPAPDADEVLDPGHRVATREVAEVADTSIERALDELAPLAETGEAERQRFPTGDTWQRSA